jgi:hypothetical protein
MPGPVAYLVLNFLYTTSGAGEAKITNHATPPLTSKECHKKMPQKKICTERASVRRGRNRNRTLRKSERERERGRKVNTQYLRKCESLRVRIRRANFLLSVGHLQQDVDRITHYTIQPGFYRKSKEFDENSLFQ